VGTWRIDRAPAPRTGLADGSADLVTFVFSFHHVPAAEMAAALAEARRLLRPAGRLYVSEPLPEGPGFEITRLYHDETVVRAEAQAALARFDTTLFAGRRRFRYGDPRKVADWASYSARAVANMRFNPFTEADVLNDRVKATFEAVMARTGGDFVQPVLVDLFERPRAA
jgi:SAM-dependent methyltransferase